MSEITIAIRLNEQQATQYLQWLDNQYSTTMADVWFSDRYRNVPTGSRAPQVLHDIPHLVGISRTRRELNKQLAGTTERSQ